MESILKRLNEDKVITIPVQSSNIATLSYNPLQFTLTILFKKGYIYGKFKYERLNNVNQCTAEIF